MDELCRSPFTFHVVLEQDCYLEITKGDGETYASGQTAYFEFIYRGGLGTRKKDTVRVLVLDPSQTLSLPADTQPLSSIPPAHILLDSINSGGIRVRPDQIVREGSPALTENRARFEDEVGGVRTILTHSGDDPGHEGAGVYMIFVDGKWERYWRGNFSFDAPDPSRAEQQYRGIVELV